MEGVACEAASLAGHLKLSNLCWIYDNNRVTLDGPAEWSFSEDVMTRFVGYGWNVTRVSDANDLNWLARGYETFLKTKDRPTLIVVDSHIGYGSPHKQDSSDAHGEPLGEGCAQLHCRCQRDGDARFVGENSERAGEKHSVADRRLRRSGPLEQNEPDVRWRGRLLRGPVWRTQLAFRRARTCHGRHREWHDLVKAACFQRDVFQF